jgi:hypothetical protein
MVIAEVVAISTFRDMQVVHRRSKVCPKIGCPLFVSLLSSHFITLGMVFVVRETRAHVYSFPM